MKMPDQGALIAHRDVGDVLGWAAAVRRPSRGDGEWLLGDQVVHDRHVVRGEIPHHVHVGLEQPQIDAHRIEVVEIADVPRIDQLLHPPDGAGEDKRVIDRQEQPAALGQVA